MKQFYFSTEFDHYGNPLKPNGIRFRNTKRPTETISPNAIILYFDEDIETFPDDDVIIDPFEIYVPFRNFKPTDLEVRQTNLAREDTFWLYSPKESFAFENKIFFESHKRTVAAAALKPYFRGRKKATLITQSPYIFKTAYRFKR